MDDGWMISTADTGYGVWSKYCTYLDLSVLIEYPSILAQAQTFNQSISHQSSVSQSVNQSIDSIPEPQRAQLGQTGAVGRPVEADGCPLPDKKWLIWMSTPILDEYMDTRVLKYFLLDLNMVHWWLF